jgi:hypothetical protein
MLSAPAAPVNVTAVPSAGAITTPPVLVETNDAVATVAVRAERVSLPVPEILTVNAPEASKSPILEVPVFARLSVVTLASISSAPDITMVEVLTVNEVRAPVASAPRVSKSAEVIFPVRFKVVSALELTVTAAAFVTDTSVMVPAKVVDAAFLSLTVTAPPT